LFQEEVLDIIADTAPEGAALAKQKAGGMMALPV
jgi:hypothetical protein